jgi:hypothetical protein
MDKTLCQEIVYELQSINRELRTLQDRIANHYKELEQLKAAITPVATKTPGDNVSISDSEIDSPKK